MACKRKKTTSDLEVVFNAALRLFFRFVFFVFVFYIFILYFHFILLVCAPAIAHTRHHLRDVHYHMYSHIIYILLSNLDADVLPTLHRHLQRQHVLTLRHIDRLHCRDHRHERGGRSVSAQLRLFVRPKGWHRCRCCGGHRWGGCEHLRRNHHRRRRGLRSRLLRHHYFRVVGGVIYQCLSH